MLEICSESEKVVSIFIDIDAFERTQADVLETLWFSNQRGDSVFVSVTLRFTRGLSKILHCYSVTMCPCVCYSHVRFDYFLPEYSCNIISCSM